MEQTKVPNQKGSLTTIQFGDFARHLALYIIGQRSSKPIMLLEDLENNTQKLSSSWDGYVVYARGRQIPETESYNITFWKDDIKELKRVNEKYKESCSITPLLAYVCVDDMEATKKIRVFWLTLADAEAMGEDFSVAFLNFRKAASLCVIQKEQRYNT